MGWVTVLAQVQAWVPEEGEPVHPIAPPPPPEVDNSLPPAPAPVWPDNSPPPPDYIPPPTNPKPPPPGHVSPT
jgi:hypothetical protein